MKLDLMRKICPPADLADLAADHRAAGRSVVLCHGCFDIVHPGHLRYLQFAHQQGDVLIVSITGDDAIEKSDGTRPYVPQELRAENLAVLEFVDHVVIADGETGEPIIAALQPDVYVKGREYEHSDHPGFLSEKNAVENGGGRVIYSSGDVVFSSTAIIQEMARTLADTGFGDASRLATWCSRWSIESSSLVRHLRHDFTNQQVIVVGDAISDQYIFCDASDVAGEAPILSVRPLDQASYFGGAAIIAAHLKQLGADVHLVTTVGRDALSEQMHAALTELGIEQTTYPTRQTLPHKMRYLVETQKLLKVDRADSQPVDTETERRMLHTLAELRTWADAVVFTDFGYGTITLPLLQQAMQTLRLHVNTITGDVSGARRTLLAYHGADLLTPTEREMRGAMADFEQSLPTVANHLMQKLRVPNLAVTMGQRGCLLFRPREDDPDQWFTSRLRSEYLPSLARHAVDPIGAGDAFLACATLGLAAGLPLPAAGYLGSAAAAITVERIGNHPLTADALAEWLRYRPELRREPIAHAG